MALINVAVNTTGSPGSAAGSAETDELWPGFLDMVQIIYHASAPPTTTVAVKESRTNGRTLIQVENNNVSRDYYPRHVTHAQNGSPESGAPGEMYITSGKLIVEVTGCNALENAANVILQIVYNRDIL